jgi:hypothetical protein
MHADTTKMHNEHARENVTIVINPTPKARGFRAAEFGDVNRSLSLTVYFHYSMKIKNTQFWMPSASTKRWGTLPVKATSHQKPGRMAELG